MRDNTIPSGLHQDGHPQSQPSYAILRLPAVLRARGRSRSSHYADIERGLFTRPARIGDRATGWPSYEVEALVRARLAGKSDNEIRALVQELHAARTGGNHDRA